MTASLCHVINWLCQLYNVGDPHFPFTGGTTPSTATPSPGPGATLGTCSAMQNVTDELNGLQPLPGATDDVCLLSTDCLDISCDAGRTSGVDLLMVISLLPCHTPKPAFRVVLDGFLNDEHVFTQSETYDIGFQGIVLNVTLDQFDGAVGIEVCLVSLCLCLF